MEISSPGLGSGLDVNGIVSQLMTVEQQPLTRLNQKEAQFQAQISTYGALKGGLSSFQTALKRLMDAATFQATTATSSDADILEVSSDTDAVTSTYSVTVNRLAQQHKLGSAEFLSTATFGGSAGDQLILTGGSNSFTLDLSTAMTLSEIQTAINVDTNETGVTAGLVSGDSGNQTLVLNSASTGYDDRVQVSFGGTLGTGTFNFSMLNRGANDVLLATENELDASLTVDGIAVTRGSNSIKDVISGLTLDLKSTGQASTTISGDTSVASSAANDFIKAYNGLKDQLSASAASGANGSVLRNIETQLRSVLNTGLTGLGDYAYVSELGVTTNSDTGKLEFDGEILISALEDNSASVISFFTDENNGLMAKFDGFVEGYVQSGGTLDSIVSGTNTRIDNIARSRESLEKRLESVEAGLFRQFGALDTLMARMSTTSDFLGRQLDALASITNRNNS